MRCDHRPTIAGDCACGAYRENIRQQNETIDGLFDRADALEEEAIELRQRASAWRHDLDNAILYARR